MRASKRIRGLTGGGDDGWGLMLRARAMLEAGQDVVELTIGEHDIRTDPVILAAMDASARAGNTGYASVPGNLDLRAEVAARITSRTGVPTGPENVLITPGGQAGLFASHMAVCDAGDQAMFIDPYYATYPGTIRGASAHPIPVQARAEHGFQPQRAALDSAFEAALAATGEATDAATEGGKNGARNGDANGDANGAIMARAALPVAKSVASLLINTPNNPTGVVYSRKTLEGIADFVTARNMWLISDEVYDTQVWQGEHLSPRALPDMAARTLVVGSMSKSHAMTGSRCGWVVGPEQVITAMADLATNTTYGVPGFVQDAALFALRAGHALEEKIAAPFRRRRAAAKAIIAAQNVVQLVPAEGAMYLMLDIRATGMSGEDFAQALLDETLIAVMPGDSFGQAAAGHVRVAMTVDDAVFADAIERLLRFANHRANRDIT